MADVTVIRSWDSSEVDPVAAARAEAVYQREQEFRRTYHVSGRPRAEVERDAAPQMSKAEAIKVLRALLGDSDATPAQKKEARAALLRLGEKVEEPKAITRTEGRPMAIAADSLEEKYTFQSAVELAHAIKSKTAQAEALMENIRNKVFSDEQRAAFREDLDTLLADIEVMQRKLNKAAGIEDAELERWEKTLWEATHNKNKVPPPVSNPFTGDTARAFARLDNMGFAGGPTEVPVKSTRGVLELGFMTPEQAHAHRDRLRKAGVL